MKGLNVLKKLLAVYSLFFASLLLGDGLNDILSSNKQQIFDYEFKTNELESDKLGRSWVNPVTLQYNRNYSTQYGDETTRTGSFSVGIDQPIFKSGGIYFAIKYSQALREANRAEITLKKREMIGSAVTLLFNIKKLKLEQKKLALLIKNDKIDIKQKRDSYRAGLLDSSFLDQAILNKNQNETQLLEIEFSQMKFRKDFSLLSGKDPEKLKLPKLKLISSAEYKGSNLELAREKLRAKEKAYNAKMTWAKYLPTLSLQGRYTDGDLNPMYERPGIKEKYHTYGFTISMPIDMNSLTDIEASKVAKLKAQTEVLDRKQSVEQEYQLVQSNLKILDKKIKLAQKNAQLYHNLYKVTKNLEKAGEKTSYDTAIMYNSLQIKKLDQQIYNIDKQVELLGLYVKVANVL